MKRVCVFGASITSGCNDYDNGGWCDRLKRAFLKDGIFIFNLGISGDDTGDLLKRIKAECNARKPDVIIIALGGNDSQFFFEQNKFRVPLEQTKINFQKIVDISKSFTSNIMIIGLTKVDEPTVNSKFMENKIMYKNEYLEKYDSAIKNIAEKNKLKFIPAFDLVLELDDGLHPTSKGHEKILERVTEYISSADF